MKLRNKYIFTFLQKYSYCFMLSCKTILDFQLSLHAGTVFTHQDNREQSGQQFLKTKNKCSTLN